MHHDWCSAHKPHMQMSFQQQGELIDELMVMLQLAGCIFLGAIWHLDQLSTDDGGHMCANQNGYITPAILETMWAKWLQNPYCDEAKGNVANLQAKALRWG